MSSVRRVLCSLVIALGGGLSAASGFAEATSWREQWRKALTLYKKKQYDAACPLFASVAQSQPKNGAVWGDLGVCELKRGVLDASIHASRLAVRFGDERVRKSAYYNLVLAGATERLPDDACATISAPSEAACVQSAAVCTKSWSGSGSVIHTFGKVAFFARNLALAEQLRDALPELDPPAEAIQTGIALSEGSDDTCSSWCGANAWQSVDSSLIMKHALACEQKKQGPLSGPSDLCVSRGKRCGDIVECAQTVLSHTSDSASVAQEWQRLLGICVKDCSDGASATPPTTCSVVHVDPCRGRVGVVCSTLKPKGGSILQASELELVEPEAP